MLGLTKDSTPKARHCGFIIEGCGIEVQHRNKSKETVKVMLDCEL